jgi:nucleotide-binding universal stress UspA family protein
MERFQPKLILCPTDFSELATFALHYARDIAACSGARLAVLYADTFMPPPHFTKRQVDELVKTIERSKQAAHQLLERYVREHLGEAAEAEMMIAESLPVSAIVNTAEQRNADLIVMGTHGRSGVSRVMLGSVTERVLRETDRPVLTVRQGPETRGPLRASIKRVLCPMNYTPVAFNALEHAVAVARCFDAELHVLHVIEPSAGHVMDEKAHEQLCDWLSEDARRRCNLQELIRRGDAAEQIIEESRALGCDLIILGAQHKRFFDSTVIGTTTVRVTRHAPCPVLTVIRKPGD